MANFEYSSDSIHVPMLFLGDGICNLQWNNVENYFDVGDCCLDNTLCAKYIYYTGNRLYSSLVNDFNNYIDCPLDICVKSNIYCNVTQLGDGICQDYNNGPLCDFDQGDCYLGPYIVGNNTKQ